jgi:Amt family ammonium transporter
MQDSAKAMRLIDQLKELGIQIVIDDFGTGYSSMSYLQQLPVDTLKVDRWFISKIKHAHTDESIHGFETIITLARNLNINLVAKGVETMAQLSVVSDLKCQLAQGVYFSKPLDKKAMDRLLLSLTEHAKTNPASAYTLQQLIAS